MSDELELNPLVEESSRIQHLATVTTLNNFDVAKAIGRIEAANFFTTVGDKLIAETAIKIKESKQFKDLPYKDENGNIRHVGDFSEFCRFFLGKSYQRTMELISNYNMLGSELYEQAEKIGFRQRDYNALKALPAEDQKVIQHAIESQLEKDQLLDLLQEMAAKNQREKEAAQKTISTLKGEGESKDQIIAEKNKLLNGKNSEIDQLKIELGTKKAQQATGEIPPEYDHLAKLTDTKQMISASIQTALRSNIQQLFNLFEGYPPAHVELEIAQSFGSIIASVRTLANDYAIQPIDEPEKADDDPAKLMAEEFMASEFYTED